MEILLSVQVALDAGVALHATASRTDLSLLESLTAATPERA